MKLELPLALGLLALGCWLFVPRQVSQHSLQKTESNTLQAPDFGVQQAGFHQQPISNAEKPIPADAKSSKTGLPSFVTPAIHSVESRRLVKKAAQKLDTGPAVQAKCRLKINLFDQALLVPGKYLHAGQGRGKTRFDFQLKTDASDIRISQICDGRLFFLQTENNGKAELNYADLELIAKSTGPEISFAGSPTNWLGMGGIGSLLTQLESSFNFEAPQQLTMGGISTWKIKGSWKPDRLRQIMQNYVDPKWIGPEIAWDRLPPQIPHSIEISLGNDEFLPLFPYRIVFNRIVDTEAGQILDPAVIVEMYEVNKLDYLADENFRLEIKDKTPVNITSRFASRLEQFRQLKANQVSELPPAVSQR